jgi:hypothetical protein
MVYIIYKLEHDDSSYHEEEAGFADTLVDACNKTYNMIIGHKTLSPTMKVRYYIRQFNTPVKPISCPVAIYTFDGHNNCIHNKQIVWSPV